MMDALVGLCSKMQPIRDLVAKVASTNTTVLLRGESGVGKEIVARAIHRASPRASKQFLKVNCAALPGGTLLLDGIGEMPLRLQAKLLHVLQDGEFSRVGGERIVGTDVRLIAATHRDLEASMRAHQFREDLYYRLNVIEIRIPPLRERREEIPVLIDHFLKKFNGQYGRAIDLPPDTLRVFMEYHWPGNIRELENAVKRVAVLGSARPVHVEIAGNLGNGARPNPPAALGAAATAPVLVADATISLKQIARQAARDAERVAIKEVLDRVHWNRAKAARLLQISYKALLYKIVQCGLVVQESDKEREAIAS